MHSRKLTTQFGPDTRFKIPLPAHRDSSRFSSDFELLKNQLILEELKNGPSPELFIEFRRAADEAAALAWASAFPLLVLPALVTEKIEEAKARSERRKQVRRRSAEIIALAV